MQISFAILFLAYIPGAAAKKCENAQAISSAANDLGTTCDASAPNLDIQKCLQPLPLSDSAKLYQDCCACPQLTCEQVASALFGVQGGSVEAMCNAMVEGSEWCTTKYSFGPQSLMDCCPNACRDPCVIYATEKFNNPSVHSMCLQVANAGSRKLDDYCSDSLPTLEGRTLAECCPIACRGTCENYAHDHYAEGTIEAMCTYIQSAGGHEHAFCQSKVASNTPMIGKDCCPESCSSPCEKFARENFQNSTAHAMCLDIEEYGGFRHSACAEKVVGDATVGEECCVESCSSPCSTYAFDHFNGKSVEDMCSDIATVGHEHDSCNAQIGLTTHTIGKDCCVEACTSPCEAYAKANFDDNNIHGMCLAIEAGGGHNHEACVVPIGKSTLSTECCPMACRSTCELFAFNRLQKNSVAEMCDYIQYNGKQDNELCETPAGEHTHMLGKDCCPANCRSPCERYAFDNFNGASLHQMCLAVEDNSHETCDLDLGEFLHGRDCCPVACRSACESHAVDHFGKNSVDEMCNDIQQNGGHEHESCGTLQGATTPTLGTDCCPMACRTPCEIYANEKFNNKNVDAMCEAIHDDGGHQNAACKDPIKDSTVGEQCCRESCDRNPCERYAFDQFQVDSVPEMCTKIADAGGFENAACFVDVGEFKVREECCVDVCRTPCEKFAFDNFNSETVEDMCINIQDAGGYKSDSCSAIVADSTVAEQCCVVACHTPCEKHAYEFFENATVAEMCLNIENNGGADNPVCNELVIVGDGDEKVGDKCCVESCRTACQKHAFEAFGNDIVDEMCQTILREGGHENVQCSIELGDVTLGGSCCIDACRSPCEHYAFDHFSVNDVPGMCDAILNNGGYKVADCSAPIGESTLNKECCVEECYSPCEKYAFEHFTNADVAAMCDGIATSGGFKSDVCAAQAGDQLVRESCCIESCRTPCEKYAFEQFSGGKVEVMCSAIHFDGGYQNSHCSASVDDSTVAQSCCMEQCRSPCETYAFEQFNEATVERMCSEINEAGGHTNAACSSMVGTATVGENCCVNECAEVEDASRRRGLRQRLSSYF